MKSGLLIVAFVVVLSGCIGSKRGNSVPAFSEVSMPAQLHAYHITNDSPATNARNSEMEGVIRAGDILLITPSLPSVIVEPAFDQRVKDDGTITFIYNKTFHAAGKRIDDLEKETRDYYVPKYFSDLTVMVRISAETHFVYVDGEFRNPGRYAWTNGMRLKDAIEAAGGFNEFANRRIKLIHSDGTSQRFRLIGDWVRTNNPALKAEDRIQNPRQLL